MQSTSDRAPAAVSKSNSLDLEQLRLSAPRSTGSLPDIMELEEMVQLTNEAGLAFVDRRKEAERLELLRTSVRARVMNRIEADSTSKLSENKLKRLAEADDEYVVILEEIAQVRAEAEALRIRYESYRNLFEARRTLISYKKTELRTL